MSFYSHTHLHSHGETDHRHQHSHPRGGHHARVNAGDGFENAPQHPGHNHSGDSAPVSVRRSKPLRMGLRSFWDTCLELNGEGVEITAEAIAKRSGYSYSQVSLTANDLVEQGLADITFDGVRTAITFTPEYRDRLWEGPNLPRK